MPVYKRKYRSGKVVWFYQFASSGSTRQNQNLVTESGFATKQEATDAEAVRRAEALVRQAATGGVAAPMPTTLAMLLAEFMKQHAEENLAPKTVERYREMAAYLAPELRAMNMTEITPLHLSREWTRLLKCGGHKRKSKTPRAMKPKTVRNIAGLVSSAFVRAIKWGLATTNPVTHSDLPKVRKRIGMALLPSEQDRLTQCATGPWCLPVFLDVSAAIGAAFGIAMIACGARSPMLIAVGMYLPFDTSSAIFVGGAMKWVADRLSAKYAPERKAIVEERGTLLASGLIAGEAIVGILLAVVFLAGIPAIATVPFYNALGGWLSFIGFAAVAWVLIRIPVKARV